jgi:hypothetical protein
MSDDHEEEWDEDETEAEERYEVWPGDNVSLDLINDGYVTTISGKIIGVKSESYLDLNVLLADGDSIGHEIIETLQIEISGVGWIDVTDSPIRKIDDQYDEEGED